MAITYSLSNTHVQNVGELLQATDVNNLANAVNEISGRGQFMIFHVKDYGATGNGTTDDSNSVRAAEDACNAAGGGIVQFGHGTYLVSGLLLDSNIWMRGQGVDATVLKLSANANYPVFITRTWATHAFTNDTNSEVNFKISDLTIDGNKANNVSGTPNGYGIRVVGAAFSFDRLRVYDCNTNGIDTEWSNSAGNPTTTGMHHSMVAHMNDVEVHDCTGSGVYWNGPHDSIWTNCIFFSNSGAGAYILTKGSTLCIVGCHSWGNSQTSAWQLASDGTQLISCTGEGAITQQVLILENKTQIHGGAYYAAGGGGGITLGSGGVAVSGYVIDDVWLQGFAAGTAINYTNDAGQGVLTGLIQQSSGAISSGTPHVSTRRRLLPTLGCTGYVDTPGGGAPTLTVQAAAGSTASLSAPGGTDPNYAFTLTPGGTGIASGALVNVVFSVARADNFNVILTLRNVNAANLNFYITNQSTTGFTINSTIAPTTGVAYAIGFTVLGF